MGPTGRASGKPVIVSDEHLLGRLTRGYGLGLVFPSGNAQALCHCLSRATHFSAEELAAFSAAAGRYRRRHSRTAYRQTLLEALAVPANGSNGSVSY